MTEPRPGDLVEAEVVVAEILENVLVEETAERIDVDEAGTGAHPLTDEGAIVQTAGTVRSATVIEAVTE